MPPKPAQRATPGIALGENVVPRTSIAAVLVPLLMSANAVHAADEIHWTITGPASASFDWRGPEQVIRFGLTRSYGDSVDAVTPNPLPFSSAGPFWEARLTGLQPGTLYHYSIGGSTDHTFRTAPQPGQSNFTVYVEGDIGSTADFLRAGIVQGIMGSSPPTFALLVGDLTYAGSNGQGSVDQHFNDVMAWSLDAAYMPAWGNAEWDRSTDDFRNYKGRFDLPNPQISPNSPQPGGIGEDWYWFDYGNTRFIAYPEPFSGAWADWYPKARALMDSAQANPTLTFIVTMGHRPAYSSGHHPGSPSLKGYLDSLGTTHPKYVLNLNGHSHGYERTYPQHGVTHITAGTGGANLEEDPTGTCLWLSGCPPPSWSAFRAYHHGFVKLTFTSTAIIEQAICGPPGDTGTNQNDLICTQGNEFDGVVIKPNGVTTGVEPLAKGSALSASLTPNPVHQEAILTFTMPQAGRARIRVLDLNGRLVLRALDTPHFDAGQHAVFLDVRDDRGVRLPSGMYFYRIETASGSITQPFAILK